MFSDNSQIVKQIKISVRTQRQGPCPYLPNVHYTIKDYVRLARTLQGSSQDWAPNAGSWTTLVRKLDPLYSCNWRVCGVAIKSGAAKYLKKRKNKEISPRGFQLLPHVVLQSLECLSPDDWLSPVRGLETDECLALCVGVGWSALISSFQWRRRSTLLYSLRQKTKETLVTPDHELNFIKEHWGPHLYTNQ